MDHSNVDPAPLAVVSNIIRVDDHLLLLPTKKPFNMLPTKINPSTCFYFVFENLEKKQKTAEADRTPFQTCSHRVANAAGLFPPGPILS